MRVSGDRHPAVVQRAEDPKGHRQAVIQPGELHAAVGAPVEVRDLATVRGGRLGGISGIELDAGNIRRST